MSTSEAKTGAAKTHVAKTNGDKIVATYHGQMLEGEFVHLTFNNIKVRLNSPYYHRTAGAHIPYFQLARDQYIDKDDRLTEYGIKRAESLLKDLYERRAADYCRPRQKQKGP